MLSLKSRKVKTFDISPKRQGAKEVLAEDQKAPTKFCTCLNRYLVNSK